MWLTNRGYECHYAGGSIVWQWRVRGTGVLHAVPQDTVERLVKTYAADLARILSPRAHAIEVAGQWSVFDASPTALAAGHKTEVEAWLAALLALRIV